jgi:biopolymer transport protein ExbD
MITRREARTIVRKALKRVPEGEEIRHLNIMPMMDMMTILLVAFLFQSVESAAFAVSDVNLPRSQSIEPPPESAITVTITNSGILVEGEEFVAVRDGLVDASDKKKGAFGMTIPRLSTVLGMLRTNFEKRLKSKGKEPPALPELMVIADKETPYRLLFQVILSSRAEIAGFRRFRLIVLEAEAIPD